MDRIIVNHEDVVIDELKNLIWDMIELYNNSKNEISNSNKSWGKNEDLRLITFDLFASTFINSFYSIIFVDECLSKKEWWESTDSLKEFEGITNESIITTASIYLTDIKINLIFNIFKHLETFMRDLDRNLPIVNNGNNKNIHKIRDEIIKFSELNLSTEFENFVKLFELIRNTMHNNGIYFNYEDKEIIYKNKKFKFVNGMSINFIDLDFLRLLLTDTNSLLKAIINSNKIKNIENIISHYSKIENQIV